MIVVILIGWMSPSKANLGPVLELPADSLVWLSQDGCDHRLMFVSEGRVLGPPRTGRLKRDGQAKALGPLAVPWSAPFRRKLRRMEDIPPYLHLKRRSHPPRSRRQHPQTDKPTPHHFMA